MRLVNEDFESTTSIGTEDNPISVFETGSFAEYVDDATDYVNISRTDTEDTVCTIYEDLEALGFVFLLASNDIHTIHINAKGKNFTRLHLEADELYEQFNSYGDNCLEMSCEDGHFINSINDAKELLGWHDYDLGHKGFSLEEGVTTIVAILEDVSTAITELYDDVSSGIQSTMDEWIRYIDSKKNYFLGRIMQESKKSSRKESMMLRNTRHDKKKCVCEHLEYLQLGKNYKMFCQVEDHIEDYDCDTVTLKPGDYIIRDFQFGHLPNGGNKGYIPYKVIDIEYDRDEDKQGYWDARKRLHLYDGDEDFYLECYNERFNGMFHKLKKSSVKE